MAFVFGGRAASEQARPPEFKSEEVELYLLANLVEDSLNDCESD